MTVRCFAAPMEGVTTAFYRRAHHKYFPGTDRYYAPFLSPTQDHRFTPREKREIFPENNQGIPVVPQLLTCKSEDFIWGARALGELGYGEINLNLGCPSGTVVAKKKGSGLLAYPDLLEQFLDEVFSANLSVDISVKTRLGLKDPAEFESLLELYNQYPISSLIVHPRVRIDHYKGPVRLEAFQRAAEDCVHPLCYNGDITCVEDVEGMLRRFPQVEQVMVGRGLIANPALFSQINGGSGATREQLEGFVEEIYLDYARAFEDRRNAMTRMKELWSYLLFLFEGSEKLGKQLKKCSDPDEYERLVKEILENCSVVQQMEVPWKSL